jgi:FG-GAP-like repeat
MTRFSRSASGRSARLSVLCVLQTLFLRLVRIAEFLTPFRSRRRPTFGILSARALVIVIVLATIGLARGQEAAASWNGLQEGLANLTDKQITSLCERGSSAPPVIDKVCVDNYKSMREFLSEAPAGAHLPALPLHLDGRSRAEANDSSTPDAGPTFAPTLSSSTPTLPFLGNWLTVLSWIPNSTTAADATAAYAVGLARLSDCSLDEGYILPGAGLPDAEYLTSLTEAQNYFHQLAGLTTTPDVFANGCAPQVLGLPATGIGLSLGFTSDGAAIVADLAGNGLYVSVTDLTANTVTSTQLSNSQNAGYFATASLRNNGIFDLVETSLTDPATQKLATAVFLGNGDGTFKPPVYYDVSDNGLGEFTIDDVTGDGIPDIVELTTTNLAVANVTTLIGKGDGTFAIGPVSAVTGVPSDQPVTGVFKTGDVKDLLVGGTVLFGAGNGSFTVGPTNAGIASATNYLFPSAVGSLRNNGKLDVVVTQPGFVSIYFGDGDGTFTVGPTYAALPDYMQVTITDVDGDGNPDIVLGTSTGGVYTEGGYDTPLPMFQILMGLGNGTFVDSPVYNQGTYGDPGNPNNSGLEIASADFNGDGKQDVLVFNNNGGSPSSLLMLPGNSTGALGTPVTSSINIAPTFLVAAKMNHDTLPDAVLAGYSLSASPQLSVLVNQGNGTFAGEKDYSLPNTVVSLTVGDFNGDGIPDVAVGVSSVATSTGPSGVYVLLGQSNGTLGAPVQVDSSMNPTGLAAGSLTTDGRTDLVVADQGYFSYVGSGQQINGALHVYLGNANGAFTTATAPTTTATNYSVAALGDLNNDGKLDLIVAGNVAGTSAGTGTPNVYTLLGNGDGTFKAANTLALGGQDGIGATSIALANVNNAGNLGAVVGNPNDYTEVLIGNGDGTLIDTLLALGQRPATVAAADLLGNGYPEILVGNANTGGQGYSLTVLQNQPTAWTATATTPTVTVTPSPASITTAQSTMVTVTVSGSGATPTGSVTLTSGTYTSAPTTLASASAVITVPGSSLAVAADTLTATYTPDSNSSSTYNSATGTNTVTVTAATTPTFALSNGGNIAVEASAITGNTSTITVTPSNGFTGAVALTCAVTTTPANPTSPATCAVTPLATISGATAQNATLTVTTTTTTTAGTYAVTVTGTAGAITMTTIVGVTVTAYVPPPTFSLTNNGPISFEAGATTGNGASITVTPANGFTGAVNLTCAVTTTPANATSPATCTVASSLTIGGGSPQNGALNVTTTTTTTPGAYAVTVTGTSGAITMTTIVSVTVTAYVAPSFTLTNGGAITISSPGATSGNTTTITVMPSGGFIGNVVLTAALATSPSGATDPPTFGLTSPVILNGVANGTGTLTVTTTAVTSGALVRPESVGAPWYTAGGTALACLLFFGIPARRRRWRTLVGMFVLLALLSGGLVSCGGKSKGGGGGGGGNPGTTAGTYTITVTGTSGSIMQTTTVTLTVQ